MSAAHWRVGRLLGRLTDGRQADQGARFHAVARRTIQRPPCAFNDWGRGAVDTVEADVALCGAKPGRRSVGWTFDDNGASPTCARCIARVARPVAEGRT